MFWTDAALVVWSGLGGGRGCIGLAGRGFGCGNCSRRRSSDARRHGHRNAASDSGVIQLRAQVRRQLAFFAQLVPQVE